MDLGECGRSLRSLASPVLRAFGAPSSDNLLYPMLGIKSRGGKKNNTWNARDSNQRSLA